MPSRATLLQVVRSSEELRTEWASMLAHQLPELPPLDDLLARLPGLLAWVDRPTAVPAEAALAPAPFPADTAAVAPPGIQYWRGIPLEAIRFAGANRLLVEFTYDARRRLVEPYSLRRASTGNLLLYGWEQGSTHIKAFNVAKMHGVRPTRVSFQPRYRIEFTPTGPLSAPPTPSPMRMTSTASRPLRVSRSGNGPTHVFECPYCSKRFRRATNNPQLRKHKSKDGWDCPGRHGYFVGVE